MKMKDDFSFGTRGGGGADPGPLYKTAITKQKQYVV